MTQTGWVDDLNGSDDPNGLDRLDDPNESHRPDDPHGPDQPDNLNGSSPPDNSIIKMNFYFKRNSIILSKQEIEM